MTNIKQQTLTAIVKDNYQAVPVLEKYNLDFCCRGKMTLAEACAEKSLATESITDELKSIKNEIGQPQMPFEEMNAEQLISYILIHHHFYVKQSMPGIIAHLQKVATKHGDKFPYIRTVYDLFTIIAGELNLHIYKEEKILFPKIKEAENLFLSGRSAELLPDEIQMVINEMEAEHEEAGDIMHEIRKLTNNYTPPQQACTTFQITLSELREFEEDLHKHVFLENSILFPKALKYELT